LARVRALGKAFARASFGQSRAAGYPFFQLRAFLFIPLKITLEMAQFDPAYKLTMTNEGGYANKAGDGGGETWRGVARKYHPDWAGWKIVDAVKATNPPSLNQALAARADLQALVLALYRKQYWSCLALDSLNCQQTANQLFDISVNCGSGTAAKMLQRALNVFHKPALVVDGKVGRLTIGAANQYPSQKIYDEINKLRKGYYEAIVASRPDQSQFMRGWLARIQPYRPDADLSHMA